MLSYIFTHRITNDMYKKIFVTLNQYNLNCLMQSFSSRQKIANYLVLLNQFYCKSAELSMLMLLFHYIVSSKMLIWIVVWDKKSTSFFGRICQHFPHFTCGVVTGMMALPCSPCANNWTEGSTLLSSRFLWRFTVLLHVVCLHISTLLLHVSCAWLPYNFIFLVFRVWFHE